MQAVSTENGVINPIIPCLFVHIEASCKGQIFQLSVGEAQVKGLHVRRDIG
jgi:hypothetical protein